jgi:iron complex transport system ATP-binding protein
VIPIEVEGLSVSYDGRAVVRNLSLAVPDRSWVALIGPNGAGKTTVLRAMAGLVEFDGDITIGSVAVREATRKRLAQLVAFVPQRPFLPSGVTVTDYVLMGRNPYIGYFSTESRSDIIVVSEVIERLELQSLVHRDVTSLSGGEAQRAVLARALAQRAPVLLLDEPTSELDVGHQQQVLELVDEIRVDVGLTVVSTMHDLTLAGQYAREFVLLDGGRAVARGSGEQVLREDLIRRHYGASVEVTSNSSGIVVVPTRAGRLEVSR